MEELRSHEALWKVFVNEGDYSPSRVDEHGRILHKDAALKDISEPIVSRHLYEKGLRIRYPGDKAFAVCLSHDIDLLNYSFLVPLLRSGATRRALRWLDRRLNPRWNIRAIIDVEERFGAKSTFFFLALQPGEKDFNYYIEDLGDEMKMISDVGWSIGLHGGYEAWEDVPLLKQQKQALESVAGLPVLGYRNHYMKIKVPATWHALEETGFVYDSTYGYPDRAGFRNGMCHPFRPFDLGANKYLRILEIPLVVMDGSLLTYMGLGPSEAVSAAKELVDRAHQYNGVISILWHNTHVAKKTPRRMYQDLLGYCSSKGAWLTSPDELCKWWLKEDPLGQGRSE